MAETTTDKPAVPALSRGSTILDMVADAPDILTVSELGRRMKLAKSSVHSLCATLCELGLLVRNSDQTFAIGPHVMRWARAFSRRSDVAAEFARIWDENTDKLQGATITLSVPDRNDVVYIGARNSSRTPWFEFQVGSRLPMAFTATGQAFMSRMADAEIRLRFRDGLPEPMTSRSPRTLDQLLKLVAEARARGYSREDQSVCEGMICFGAPVLNASNTAIAGVAVSMPVDDIDPAREAEIVATLKRIATTISQRLGADIDG
ncbi:IclR family transcriptional regulator [Tropicimonas sp. IMCC34043]|uniref:IclR family transcriptional regulator n=1 Tax=Tropicimonas sp. IMCC34043 TaxID=2248760 RepID=UPI0018E4F7FB|nr:IclR family transcriptional regulator [Tropicimonas sp. IMCC34043]